MTLLLGNLTIETMNDLKRSFDRMQEQILQIAELLKQQHKTGHDFGSGDLLFPAEIHTIQVIGENNDINVTDLAKRLSVSKATVSERIKKLAQLQLINKEKSSNNRKEAIVHLTQRGWIAFEGHERHHQAMYEHFHRHFGKNTPAQIRKCQQAFGAYLSVIRNAHKPPC